MASDRLGIDWKRPVRAARIICLRLGNILNITVHFFF